MKMVGLVLKMGIKKGLTHAPEEMKELKDITLNEKFIKGKGTEKQIENFNKIYKNDLVNNNKIDKKIKDCCCLWKWNGRCICP